MRSLLSFFKSFYCAFAIGEMVAKTAAFSVGSQLAYRLNPLSAWRNDGALVFGGDHKKRYTTQSGKQLWG
jgi:hypothetical protein